MVVVVAVVVVVSDGGGGSGFRGLGVFMGLCANKESWGVRTSHCVVVVAALLLSLLRLITASLFSDRTMKKETRIAGDQRPLCSSAAIAISYDRIHLKKKTYCFPTFIVLFPSYFLFFDRSEAMVDLALRKMFIFSFFLRKKKVFNSKRKKLFFIAFSV